MRVRRTLIAPERLCIETPKNVAADEEDLLLNSNHRAMETGRMTKEYATG